MKFKELGLSEDLLKAITSVGYEEATPIQAETIPMVLAGQDVIGQAQTGTGKTAAFALPILEKIDKSNENVQALVVSPTRELAIQTQEEIYKLGRTERANVQVVYGGADIRRQIKSLKNHPQVVVGTPGRLLDHIRRHTLKLDHVQMLVLDEADEMLNMGFLDDIEDIIKQLPEERQTMLFSATMPPEIKRVGVQFMKDPKHVKIKAKELTTDLIDQFYVRSRDFEKFDVMTRFFDVQSPDLTIVFTRTKRRVDEIASGLEARGYNAADILVATDVAARGIDINDVTHVYNYDIPQDPDSYVHRVGRTGRAGKHGVSMTFVTPNEMDYLREIEKLTKVRMLPLKPPSDEEAFVSQLGAAKETIADLVNKADKEKYAKAAESLLNEYDAEDLVAALLSDVTKDDNNQVPVKITPERPLPKRGGKRHGGGGYHHGGGNRRGGNGGGGYRGGHRSSDRHGNDRGHGSRNHDSRNHSDNRSHRSNNGGGRRNEGGSRGFTIRKKD
ncbi:DEAD/DEAH box helicase [Levilactobacillus brevis]|nr:DEAD/DEAH box helicase [Levilactobacillus brevis]